MFRSQADDDGAGGGVGNRDVHRAAAGNSDVRSVGRPGATEGVCDLDGAAGRAVVLVDVDVAAGGVDGDGVAAVHVNGGEVIGATQGVAGVDGGLVHHDIAGGGLVVADTDLLALGVNGDSVATFDLHNAMGVGGLGDVDRAAGVVFVYVRAVDIADQNAGAGGFDGDVGGHAAMDGDDVADIFHIPRGAHHERAVLGRRRVIDFDVAVRAGDRLQIVADGDRATGVGVNRHLGAAIDLDRAAHGVGAGEPRERGVLKVINVDRARGDKISVLCRAQTNDDRISADVDCNVVAAIDRVRVALADVRVAANGHVAGRVDGLGITIVVVLGEANGDVAVKARVVDGDIDGGAAGDGNVASSTAGSDLNGTDSDSARPMAAVFDGHTAGGPGIDGHVSAAIDGDGACAASNRHIDRAGRANRLIVFTNVHGVVDDRNSDISAAVDGDGVALGGGAADFDVTAGEGCRIVVRGTGDVDVDADDDVAEEVHIVDRNVNGCAAGDADIAGAGVGEVDRADRGAVAIRTCAGRVVRAVPAIFNGDAAGRGGGNGDIFAAEDSEEAFAAGDGDGDITARADVVVVFADDHGVVHDVHGDVNAAVDGVGVALRGVAGERDVVGSERSGVGDGVAVAVLVSDGCVAGEVHIRDRHIDGCAAGDADIARAGVGETDGADGNRAGSVAAVFDGHATGTAGIDGDVVAAVDVEVALATGDGDIDVPGRAEVVGVVIADDHVVVHDVHGDVNAAVDGVGVALRGVAGERDVVGSERSGVGDGVAVAVLVSDGCVAGEVHIRDRHIDGCAAGDADIARAGVGETDGAGKHGILAVAASFDGDAAGAGGGDGHVSAAVDFDCTAAGSLVDGHGARGAPPKGVVFADVDGPGSGMVLPDINAGAANDRDLAAVGIDSHAPARECIGAVTTPNRDRAGASVVDSDARATDHDHIAVSGLVDRDNAAGEHVEFGAPDDDPAAVVGVHRHIGAAVDVHVAKAAGLIDSHCAGWRMARILVTDGDAAVAAGRTTREYLVANGDIVSAHDCDVAKIGVDHDIPGGAVEITALDTDDHITEVDAEDPDVVAADNAHDAVIVEMADHDIARGNHAVGCVANCDAA